MLWLLSVIIFFSCSKRGKLFISLKRYNNMGVAMEQRIVSENSKGTAVESLQTRLWTVVKDLL